MSKKEKNPRLGKVGGEAVLEGVMMKSGDRYTLAVREENGNIKLQHKEFVSVRKKHKIFNIPLLRGIINFIEMMKLSYSTLSDSARMLGLDDFEEETKFDKWLKDKLGDRMMSVLMVFALVFGIVIGVGLFALFPTWIAQTINNAVGEISWVLYQLVAGLVRIGIFVLYIWLVSFIKDIRRTFEYHGAEHKTVACYEAGLDLTPENAATCTRFHPRCGTSFIFVMLIISILVYSFIPRTDNIFLLSGLKLLLLPVIVGLGFEFLIIAGKHPNALTYALSYPGLLMQRFTTREPDKSQLEVAIAALRGAMPDEFPPEKDENSTDNDTKNTAKNSDFTSENNNYDPEPDKN